MKIYRIDEDYTESLRTMVDGRVSYNRGEKNRPYVGIVVNAYGHSFFAPMTHITHSNAKERDLVFTLNGKGTILLNNMIPVIPEAVKEFDIKQLPETTESEKKYKNLLLCQAQKIRKYASYIEKKAENLLKKQEENRLKTHFKITRTCDFKKMVNFIDSDGFKTSKLYKKLKNQAQISQLKQKETTMNAYLKSVKNGVIKPKKQNVLKKVYQKKI